MRHKYFAFISYKREGTDEKVANWIHNKLEKYPYPKELVEKENAPDDADRIRKIFIDTKELPVTDKDFTYRINECIKNSRYLVVVCSAKSAQSQFVEREVEYFLSTHNNDTDKILPVTTFCISSPIFSIPSIFLVFEIKEISSFAPFGIHTQRDLILSRLSSIL